MLNVKLRSSPLQRSAFFGKVPRCLPRPSKQSSRSSRRPCTAVMAFLSNPVVIGTGAVVLTAVAAAIIDARRSSRLPKVKMQLNEFNRAVLSRCPNINSLYRVVPFLTNGYVPICCCIPRTRTQQCALVAACPPGLICLSCTCTCTCASGTQSSRLCTKSDTYGLGEALCCTSPKRMRARESRAQPVSSWHCSNESTYRHGNFSLLLTVQGMDLGLLYTGGTIERHTPDTQYMSHTCQGNAMAK